MEKRIRILIEYDFDSCQKVFQLLNEAGYIHEGNTISAINMVLDHIGIKDGRLSMEGIRFFTIPFCGYVYPAQDKFLNLLRKNQIQYELVDEEPENEDNVS